MITLDTTTKSLEVVLGGAVATTQLPFVASYVDISQLTFAMTASSENDGTTNSTTAVSLVAAPAASTTRKLNFLSIFNVDTAVVVLTIRLNNNSTTRICWKGTLAIGDNLTYTDGIGFKITDANGQTKTGPTVVSLTSGITGILPVANGGTNLVSYAVGDILHATASGVIGSLAAVAVGNIFASAGVGVVPGWTATIPTAVQDNITRLGTIAKNLLFTDATYDIGASGATRPRDLFLSRNAVVGGTLTVSGFGTHSFSAGGTGANVLEVANTTSGPANYVGLRVAAGTSAGVLMAFSQGYTTSGPDLASSTQFLAQGAGGLSLVATHASGAIRFYSGGATKIGEFQSGGDFYTNDGTVHSLSDARTKTLVRPFVAGIEALKAVQTTLGVYRYRDDLEGVDAPRSSREFVAITAQSAQTAIPEAVDVGGDGYLTMTTTPLFYAAINAVVSHDARIAALESALSALRAERN